MLPPGTPDIYYHGINFIFEVISILLFIIIGLFLMIKKKEDDTDLHRKIKTGYGMFALFYSLCRIFFIIAVWFPDESWSANSYDYFVVVGYLFATLGLTSIIIVVERYLVRKTRYIFTILGLIMVVIYGISVLGMIPQDMALLLSFISSPVLIGVLVILYLTVAIRGTASIRRTALLMLTTIFMMGVAAIIDGESLVIAAPSWFDNDLFLLELFYSVAPTILIIGIIAFCKVTY
ncbi:MAG: hypothetical protein ACTSUE_17205 [Promethearchaeota archaeon]